MAILYSTVRVDSNLLRELQAMPLEKLYLPLLRLSRFFSQGRRPLQLASSNLLDVYRISIIINARRSPVETHNRPRQVLATCQYERS
jgi:hypothetical protein